MPMPPNSFKQTLQQGQMQLGLFLALGNALSAEVLATCGYDYLLIDAEHAVNDLRSIQSQLQAIAAYPVPWNAVRAGTLFLIILRKSSNTVA